MTVKKVITTVNRRLSNILRYNNTPRIRGESVAEHSFYVAFYVMMLSDFVEGIDKDKALCMALLHDVEEAISGDIPQNVKNEYPVLNEALEEMNFLIAKKIFTGVDEKYLNLWCSTREINTLESKLVLLADILSGYMYTLDELNMGNTFMKHINLYQYEKIQSIISKEPKFEVLSEVLQL